MLVIGLFIFSISSWYTFGSALKVPFLQSCTASELHQVLESLRRLWQGPQSSEQIPVYLEKLDFIAEAAIPQGTWRMKDGVGDEGQEDEGKTHG